MNNQLQPFYRGILLAVSVTVLVTELPAMAGDLEIERHETAGIVDLVPGEARGTITQPLLTGTIALTGQEVLFVMSDASDKDVAEMFGVIRADSLQGAPDAAVETAIFDNGRWTFFEDPGLVARFDPLTGVGNRGLTGRSGILAVSSSTVTGTVMSRDRGGEEGLWEKLTVCSFKSFPFEKIQVGVLQVSS